MNCPFTCKPRWERRKDARPQELLSAALDVFVERGYAATRLEDVAKLAGVSKGTLYLYFTNKEELFKAVVRENLIPQVNRAEELIASHEGDTPTLFRKFIYEWWERIGNTKLSGISKLILAESSNFPELAHFYNEEVIMRASALLARLLERGVAQGEFRPVDTQELTHVICAPIVMLMLWKHSSGVCPAKRVDPQRYLENFIDLCLHGLSAQPAPAQ